MSKTQKNVGKKTFKKVAKKKVSKPSKKTGLKKKVVSMKLKRKVKKVHRKKMKRGGAKILSGETDLGKIWNTILLNKSKVVGKVEGNVEGLIEKTPVKGKKYVLFVIDMQNDFSDAIYKREGSVKLINNATEIAIKIPTETEPVHFKVRDLNNSNTTYDEKLYPVLETEKNACLDITIGNFGVAGVNNSLIDNLVTKIKDALKDPNCKEIIFTRDYHPDGHMSFSMNSSLNVPQYCTCQGGNFPVHCLQGHSGSRLIPEIEGLLLDDATVGKEKVRILFKGFDLNCDSFTAVRKNPIDNFASNQEKKKSNEEKTESNEEETKSNQEKTESCSSLSGAYDLVKLGPGAAYIQAAIKYNEHIISAKNLSPYVNDTKFNDVNNVEEFQVCGLAGDYCVRDTVVSLAQMFPGKQVTLLGGLTRYAVLPLFTMQTVPIHNYRGNKDVPNRNGTGEVALLVKDSSNNPEVNPEVNPSDKDSSDKLVINPEVVENFNAIDTNKSLYYYTLTMDKGTYQLVQTTADGKGLTKEVNQDNFSIPDVNFFHFITPPEVIIEDYKANSTEGNIKIRLYTGDVGSRLPVLAVCDTNAPKEATVP